MFEEILKFPMDWMWLQFSSDNEWEVRDDHGLFLAHCGPGGYKGEVNGKPGQSQTSRAEHTIIMCLTEYTHVHIKHTGFMWEEMLCTCLKIQSYL